MVNSEPTISHFARVLHTESFGNYERAQERAVAHAVLAHKHSIIAYAQPAQYLIKRDERQPPDTRMIPAFHAA